MITCVSVDDIEHLHVHKGTEPSVDIKCKHPTDKENFHSIRILFPGDMERQKIVGSILALYRLKGKEDPREAPDDNDQQNESEDEDEEGEKEGDGSDEDALDAVLYDWWLTLLLYIHFIYTYI